MRWFFFCHAGGSGAYFNQLRLPALAGVQPVFVDYPGHGTRMLDSSLTSVMEVARAVIRDVELPRDEAFGVFGHSYGALIAYEFSRLLKGLGHREPQGMIMSACRPPWIEGPRPALHEATDSALVEELRRLDGTPDEILKDPEVLEFVLPAFRADLQASELYSVAAEPHFACEIVALGGRSDVTVSAELLEEWQLATTGRFSRIEFEGGHFYLTGNPTFPQRLSELLRRMSSDSRVDELVVRIPVHAGQAREA